MGSGERCRAAATVDLVGCVVRVVSGSMRAWVRSVQSHTATWLEFPGRWAQVKPMVAPRRLAQRCLKPCGSVRGARPYRCFRRSFKQDIGWIAASDGGRPCAGRATAPAVGDRQQSTPSRRWHFSGRAAAPLRKAPFANQAEKSTPRDCGRSRIMRPGQRGRADERLLLQAANWHCRPSAGDDRDCVGAGDAA